MTAPKPGTRDRDRTLAPTIILSALVASITLLGIFAGLSGDWRVMRERGATIPAMQKLLDEQQSMLISQSQQNTTLVTELAKLRERLDEIILGMRNADLRDSEMRAWVDARIEAKVPPAAVVTRLVALEAITRDNATQVRHNSLMLARIATKIGVNPDPQ